jgi:cephalosporin hydroxylase
MTAGNYLVVEDTNVNGHPCFPTTAPGPTEALETFLAETDVETDVTREEFFLSFNPLGFLRRKT